MGFQRTGDDIITGRRHSVSEEVPDHVLLGGEHHLAAARGGGPLGPKSLSVISQIPIILYK